MSNYTVYANQAFDIRKAITVTTTENLVYAVEKAMQAAEEGVKNHARSCVVGDPNDVVAAFRNDDGNVRLSHDSCPSSAVLKKVIKAMYDKTLADTRQEREQRGVAFLKAIESELLERNFDSVEGVGKTSASLGWTAFDFRVDAPNGQGLIVTLNFRESGDTISLHECDGEMVNAEIFDTEWTPDRDPMDWVRAILESV